MSDIELMSQRTCQVLTPVTLCCIYIVILMDIITRPIYRSVGIMNGAWAKLGLEPKEAFSETFINNIIIVGVFLLLLIFVTLLILFIFYMEWHGCLSFYFYLPPIIIMVVLTPTYAREVLMALNWFAVDVVSVAFITYNFAALGMIAIFGIGGVETPLLIQQFYLIHNSAILAILIISSLPGWAPWLLLTFLILWDLFAVLAPYGPLNLIINLAEREGIVDMPGLIYSTETGNGEDKNNVNKSGAPVQDANSTEPKSTKTEERNLQKEAIKEPDGAKNTGSDRIPESKTERVNEIFKREEEEIEELDRGLKLGLGDFIFYGVLIGKASCDRDWVITLSCYVSILVGLSVTLLLLATFKKPLPALPVSIALGMSTYFISKYFGVAFSHKLGFHQIFI